MCVRLLFVLRHNLLLHVNVVLDCYFRETYKILSIENWSAVYVHYLTIFEQFTRNYVSHLNCPDLSRSRQCFFPIASRLFHDGVDDDDDDDDEDDGDDVTSGSGHYIWDCRPFENLDRQSDWKKFKVSQNTVSSSVSSA